MISDGLFGVCLVDESSLILGWEAPRMVGTIAKITGCKDVGLDGIQLDIETIGRNPFVIKEVIPPCMSHPTIYDPQTIEGHQAVVETYEDAKASNNDKMYIRAKVEMTPEIDGDISLSEWEDIIRSWKTKVETQAHPKKIEPGTLDHMLQHYYLVTDTPTVEYVYSLCALGAEIPSDLQDILEATSMGDLIYRTKVLMSSNNIGTPRASLQ